LTNAKKCDIITVETKRLKKKTNTKPASKIIHGAPRTADAARSRMVKTKKQKRAYKKPEVSSMNDGMPLASLD
jgi:hypothetical protein